MGGRKAACGGVHESIHLLRLRARLCTASAHARTIDAAAARSPRSGIGSALLLGPRAPGVALKAYGGSCSVSWCSATGQEAQDCLTPKCTTVPAGQVRDLHEWQMVTCSCFNPSFSFPFVWRF